MWTWALEGNAGAAHTPVESYANREMLFSAFNMLAT